MDLGRQGLNALVTGGTKGIGRAVDVGDGPALKAWVKDAGDALGGIDIVVANVSAPAIASDETGWQHGFKVDMMGTVRLVDTAMPRLERSAHASIVTISRMQSHLRLLHAPLHRLEVLDEKSLLSRGPGAP